MTEAERVEYCENLAARVREEKREKRRAYDCKWRKANQEAERERNRKWKEINPEKYRKWWVKATSSIEGALKVLCRSKGRNLDPSAILQMFYSQEGKCAISGVKMTWGFGRGRVSTNVSIDRVDSSKGYTVDNVQLVCDYVNCMKLDQPQEKFIQWCEIIVGYSESKQSRKSVTSSDVAFH
jgi:hypothetical protein